MIRSVTASHKNNLFKVLINSHRQSYIQVRRFNEVQSVRLSGQEKEFKLSAIAVNEDNRDEKVFTQLKKGQHRICYASPEILLRNSKFKKLFRLENFRRSLVAIVVDEAHVIESWKDDFRKDYGELETLRIIAGTEIPWLALTATCSTRTFEIIYQSLGMGGRRPFYGLDLGADRPNIAQWVRPMEYSANSLHDILAFVPVSPKSPSDFKKSIFYFKTRQLCRQARDICRAVVAPEFRKVMFAFTAVSSEEFKLKVINMLRDGKDVRWMFATIAAGMGTDIPDIEQSIIFGVDPLGETFQKGGRAGRAATMNAIMIWIVEPWAFEPRENSASKPNTKKLLGEEEKRQKMDQNAREYINHSQSPFCMRVYAASHFRPEPNLPGFKWYRKPDSELDNLDLDMDENQEEYFYASVTWEVVEQEIRCGNGMCSASVCRENPDVAVGVLSVMDHQIIANHLNNMKGKNSVAHHSSDSEDGTTPAVEPIPSLRCSKPEREILHEALLSWRDTEWAGIKSRFPFFSREWVMTNENISRLVDKAHLILNASMIDATFISSIAASTLNDSDPIINSLTMLLEDFRENRRSRDVKAALERQTKRRARTIALEFDDPFRVHPQDMAPVDSSSSLTGSWQIPGYFHER